MKFSFLIISLLLQLTWGSSSLANSPKPEITVSDNIQVLAGSAVKLKDVASLSYIVPAQAKRLLELDIISPMSDGDDVEYSSGELIRLLKTKILEAPEALESQSSLKWAFFIPEKVKITATKNSFSKQRAMQEIQWAILEKCNRCQVNFSEIKIPKITESSLISNCNLDVTSVKLGGSFLVPLACDVAQAKKTYWISGMIRLTADAPVAVRQISPGEKIFENDIKINKVDVTFAKDGVPTLKEVIGNSMTRIISVNQPIFKTDIRREFAIKRGQLVRATTGDELVEVTGQATAEENGFIGDVIKLKSLENQKIILGEVLETGLVRIK